MNYRITQNGRELSRHNTETDAWRRLLDIQGMSVHRAVTEEGYDIEYPNGTTLSADYKKGQGR